MPIGGVLILLELRVDCRIGGVRPRTRRVADNTRRTGTSFPSRMHL